MKERDAKGMPTGPVPETLFLHATGYKRAESVATYFARFCLGRDLSGIVAGHVSQKKVVDYVAAFPTPEVLQGQNRQPH